MGHLLGQWAVDRYFTRGLGPRAEAGLRAHLRGCHRCNHRYQRHLLAESLLPEGERLAGERLWRGIGRARPAAPARLWLALGLAGAAAALLLLVPRFRSEPAERGGARGSLVPPAIHLYRVEGPGRAAPVGARIAANDALLLAYSNPGPVYDHLMVFAVDQRYRVHWFYPAYLRAEEDPTAIPIARERAGVELGEAISHDFTPGKLRVYALFLDRALRVSRIEALVAATLAAPGAPLEREALLPVAGAHQSTQLLEVSP
jgi:hypothetical protein